MTTTEQTETKEGDSAQIEERRNANDVKAFNDLYTMKEEIAKGGYATVFLANPKSDNEKEYAVKVIDRNNLKEKDVQSVFREAEILQELKELPNVISIVDFIVEPQYFYVVQFYAGGGDLFSKFGTPNDTSL